jgi:hypothetical protein
MIDDDDFIDPIAHRVPSSSPRAIDARRTSFVHHPASSHARRRRRRAHFRWYGEPNTDATRTERTNRPTRSVVVVHSFGVIRSDT